MLILAAVLFVVILIVLLFIAYNVFDDLETFLWPGIVVSAIGAGGISFSLSQFDRTLIIGCTVVLAAAIVLAGHLIGRSRVSGGRGPSEKS